MSRGKTGGNLEPMPYVRRWGAAAVEEEGGQARAPIGGGAAADGNGDYELATAPAEVSSPKKHRHRSSKSPSKKDKRRSRSPDKKKHKRRSKSPKSKRRSRSRSRERGSGKRAKAERSHEGEEELSAFPPPADVIQQVQLRQQEIERQIFQAQQQQQQAQRQFKQEMVDAYGQQLQLGGQQQQFYQQQGGGGGGQQDWQQQGQMQYSQEPAHQQQQQQQLQPPKNDALSAALAAAAMVAQKLNKSGAGGGAGAAATPDLMNKLPSLASKTNTFGDSVLSKDHKGDVGAETPGGEKRRKSRWSNTKSFVPGMPTILPADIDDTQRQIYLLQMDIEETTRRLRQQDFGQNVDPAERSTLILSSLIFWGHRQCSKMSNQCFRGSIIIQSFSVQSRSFF